MVMTFAVRELERSFERTRVLVKVDVEGYEPTLMAGFKDIVCRYRTDFFERLDFLSSYERYIIGPEGLQRRTKLEADEHHRDWLLRAPQHTQ